MGFSFKAGTTATATKNAVSMSQIARAGRDFKILDAIIVSDAIKVINFHCIGYLPNEGFGNEPMDAQHSLYTGTIEADSWVAIRVEVMSQNPSRSGPASRLDSADPSEVADFVPAFVSDNGTPFFIYDFGSRVGHDHSMSDAVSGLPMR